MQANNFIIILKCCSALSYLSTANHISNPQLAHAESVVVVVVVVVVAVVLFLCPRSDFGDY